MSFSTNYQSIINQIDEINPKKYGATRNFADGAVTKLSPYISRGIISTKQIATTILSKGYKPYEIESFLKELAWRDYFQQVWKAKGSYINTDVKQPQPNCNNHKISKSILSASVGIDAIDRGINELMDTGYMHNHMRMYVASIACNVARSHWKMPAQWMYYFLLDADWASNCLSWQWVAGSFSSKKYIANQENINKYWYTNQVGSFLDVSYDTLANMETPNVLKELENFDAKTSLPNVGAVNLDSALPTFIYNFYNLDCNWKKEESANRILLLEPSFFAQYPVCDRTIQFVLALAKNIAGLQVCVAEFDDVFINADKSKIHFKEHPTNTHYRGVEHKRDWMFEDVTGYYPSFFSYWKKCEKYLMRLTQ